MKRAFLLIPLLTVFAITPLSAAGALDAWNLLYAKLAAQDPPHLQSRGLAMLNLAIHDAVNAVQPKFGAYRLEGGAYIGGSAEAAAASAGRHLLPAILPPTALPEIEAAYTPLINAVTEPRARALGITAGQAAAALLVKERMGDLALIDGPIPNANRIDRYQTTPPLNVPNGVFSGWGRVAPFTMRSAEQFRPGPPPSPSSAAYAREYNEVKEIGAANSTARSAAQTDLANFWFEGGSPTGWNRIALSAATAAKLDAAGSARLLALVSAALADAYILQSEAKYTYYRWRPLTAIHNGGADGNSATTADPNWAPLLFLPPDPEYPSGHAVGAGAAAEVLMRILGTDYVSITATSATLPGKERQLDSFSIAAQESADSRVIGGVHFASSRDAGLEAGRRLGRQAAQTYLRPLL